MSIKTNNFLPEVKGTDYFPPPLGAKPKGLGLPMKSMNHLVKYQEDRKSGRRGSAYGLEDIKENNSKISSMVKARANNHSSMGLSKHKDGSKNSQLGYPGTLPTLGLNKYKNMDL